MEYTTYVTDELTTDPFPSFDDGLEPVLLDDDIEADITAFVADAYGITWEFDFEEGDLLLSAQGATSLASGIDAVRQWCRHVLTTRRGESPIHSPEIGVDLDGLLGSRTNDSYVKARIRQEITGALVLHDRIDSVTVDDIITSGSNAFVFVTIRLDTGEEIEDAIGL